jgi:N-acetylneuraminic acid mutarotase
MKIVRNSLLIALFTLAVVTTFISCKDKDDTIDLIGNWLELADFGGDARYEAVAFSIGEIGYVGTGYNGDDRLNDFWAYDAELNNWTAIATDTALTPRTGAVAFSAGGKGYVGTGRDDQDELKDFWSYDPDDNRWTKVADIPVARFGAVAFSINDIGYVGTGYNGSPLLDFFAYDPTLNSWTPISNYPSKVREAVAFVLDNKGYVCTGEKNGIHIDDFYMYDPATNIWSAKRRINNVSDESYDDTYAIIRKKAVAFTIGGKAYITNGDYNALKPDVWEYDPVTDLWDQKTLFEGLARNNAVAFSTQNGRGFVTTGVNGATAFDDLFEFKPLDDLNEDD